MRVLDTESGQFVQINHLGAEYAILSHTWDHENGEQTYAQLKRIQERYISGSSARPLEDIPHPQDNTSSTTTPPDRPSSASVLTGSIALSVSSEGLSPTTVPPNENTPLLANSVRSAEGRDVVAKGTRSVDATGDQSCLCGPWRRMLQLLLLVTNSVVHLVELIGDVPQCESSSTPPEPVLAEIIVHDSVVQSPADESSPPPPPSSPPRRLTSAPQ